MLPLVQLLHDPSSSVQVPLYIKFSVNANGRTHLNVYTTIDQVAVLGALSNIVLDFSSPKSTFIEYGGIKQLIELSKSMDPNTRCSALRATRNLMFLADNKRKELFYSDVKAQGFASLISGKQSPLKP